MDPQIAQAIYGYLQRVTIEGREVPVYIRCAQALEQIIYAAQVQPQAPQQQPVQQHIPEQEDLPVPAQRELPAMPVPIRRPAGV